MVYKRAVYPDKIANAFKHVSIVVLIGARQVGKTSIMQDFSRGKDTVFLNGQDPETADLFQK
jgi:predicted AAA+ superfamily ATPase